MRRLRSARRQQQAQWVVHGARAHRSGRRERTNAIRWRARDDWATACRGMSRVLDGARATDQGAGWSGRSPVPPDAWRLAGLWSTRIGWLSSPLLATKRASSTHAGLVDGRGDVRGVEAYTRRPERFLAGAGGGGEAPRPAKADHWKSNPVPPRRSIRCTGSLHMALRDQAASRSTRYSLGAGRRAMRGVARS